jgi:hypothetical protein
VQAEEELYASNVLHVETDGREFKGFDNVLQKEKQFLENKSLITVSDPIVASNFFSINMHMEITHKELGNKIIDEIVIYEVNNNKIVFLRCYY